MNHPIIAAVVGVLAAAAFIGYQRYCRCAPRKTATDDIQTWESEGGCVSVSDGKTASQVPQTTPAG